MMAKANGARRTGNIGETMMGTASDSEDDGDDEQRSLESMVRMKEQA